MAVRKPKPKRVNPAATWKVARRCVFFFTTVCVIPVALVLLVTTDQYLRPLGRNRLLLRRHQAGQFFEDGTVLEAQPLNATAVEKRLAQRKKYLKMACQTTGLNVERNDSLHRPNPWEYLISNKYNLVWCNIFKAASTSWMYNFNVLAGYSPAFLKKTKVVPLSLARRKYPRPSLQALQDAFNASVSFIIVRHPFERLLSGYRDKFQFSLPNTYHRKLGNVIISTYRRATVYSDRTFHRKCPTFNEFVSFVIDSVKFGHPLDMHWTPIAEFCTPCMFPLDVIAHIETLQEDQEYIIRKARLEHIIKSEWKNNGRNTLAHVKSYYSQLTRSQILQLYHIYRYDFMLFNYTISGYLEMAQPDFDRPSSPSVDEEEEDVRFSNWISDAHDFLNAQNEFNNVSSKPT